MGLHRIVEVNEAEKLNVVTGTVFKGSLAVPISISMWMIDAGTSGQNLFYCL
ncbi:hypothetical protein [Nitrosomonas sp.]|uniref:hypothetical protein n=1 Tax=Nitrosomonas sp. TaxID=42353 RepID=UPI0025FD5994|nr:hypothetical protein [Nitrosomonas sp.]MBS0588166.1 hypothetical protein [Pseudomonadota bacterium]